MQLRFEWDPWKALLNLKKHGVSFHEAQTVFGDPLSLTVGDPDRSPEEFRFAIMGRTRRGRLVVVAHVERDDTIRIISVRGVLSYLGTAPGP